MPSRYSSAYEPIDWKKYLDAQKAPSEPRGAKQARGWSDIWSTIGDIAPVAGTALGALGGGTIGALGGGLAAGAPTGGLGFIPGAISGGLGGAAAGAALGGGLGGAGSQFAHQQAQRSLEPTDRAEAERRQKLIEREARLSALREMLGMMR